MNNLPRPPQAPVSSQKPRRGLKSSAVAGLFGLAVGAISAPASAALSGNLGLRDVSRLIESDGRFYIYGTGGGGKSTADGLVFEGESTSPPWNLSYQPGNQRIWAPDGLYLNGRYYLYGSMWSETSPKKASVIVLLTTPSLNPANAKWKDEGVAISGPSGVTHSVIDPSPILDPDGNLWLVWGGGYPFDSGADSIFLTRMDNDTGLPLTTDPGWKPSAQPGWPLKQGHKEGPAIYHHGDYFYLFYQTGSCCSTNNGGYVMHVSRASKITGPYTSDAQDHVFYNASTKPGVTGPGHMGVYNGCGVERFTYHYISSSSGTIIGSNEFVWGADGWPTVGNVVSTPLKPCGVNASVNGASSTGAGGGTSMMDPGSTAGGGNAGTGSDAGGAAGAGNSGGAGETNASGSGGDITGSGGSTTESGGSTSSGGSDPTTHTTSAGSTGTTGGSNGSAAAGAPPAPSDDSGCSFDAGKSRGAGHGTRAAMWLLGAGVALRARRRRKK